LNHIYPSTFAGASFHLLIACQLSGKNLPVMPSRESNLGLTYSKPTRYQLSHAAPFLTLSLMTLGLIIFRKANTRQSRPYMMIFYLKIDLIGLVEMA
jgi:hypothetical protein